MEYDEYVEHVIDTLQRERTGIILARQHFDDLLPFDLFGRYSIPTTIIEPKPRPELNNLVQYIHQHGIPQSADLLKQMGAQALSHKGLITQPQEVEIIPAYLASAYNEAEAREHFNSGIRVFATLHDQDLRYHTIAENARVSLVKEHIDQEGVQLLFSGQSTKDTAKLLSDKQMSAFNLNLPGHPVEEEFDPAGAADEFPDFDDAFTHASSAGDADSAWSDTEWAPSSDEPIPSAPQLPPGTAPTPELPPQEIAPDTWGGTLPLAVTPLPAELDAQRAIDYLKTILDTPPQQTLYGLFNLTLDPDNASISPRDRQPTNTLEELVGADMPLNALPFVIIPEDADPTPIVQELQNTIGTQQFAIIENETLHIYNEDGQLYREYKIPVQPAPLQTRIFTVDAIQYITERYYDLPEGVTYLKHTYKHDVKGNIDRQNLIPAGMESSSLEDLIEQDGEQTIPIAVVPEDVDKEVDKLAHYTQEHSLPGFGIVHNGTLTLYKQGETTPMKQTYTLPLPELSLPGSSDEIVPRGLEAAEPVDLGEVPAGQPQFDDQPPQVTPSNGGANAAYPTVPDAELVEAPRPEPARSYPPLHAPSVAGGTPAPVHTPATRVELKEDTMPTTHGGTRMTGRTTPERNLELFVENQIRDKQLDKKSIKNIHKMTKPKRGIIRKTLWNPVMRTMYGLGLGVALAIGIARYSPQTHNDVQDAITQHLPAVDETAEQIGLSPQPYRQTGLTEEQIRAIARAEIETTQGDVNTTIQDAVQREYERLAAMDAAERACMDEQAIRNLIRQQYGTLTQDLDERITALQTLVNNTRTSIQTHRQNVEGVRREMYEDIGQRIDQLNTRVQAIEASGVDLGPYEQRLNQLREQVNALPGMQNQLRELQDRVDRLEYPIHPGDIDFQGTLSFVEAGRTQHLLDAYRRKWLDRSGHEPRVSEYARVLAEVSSGVRVDRARVEQQLGILEQQGIAAREPRRPHTMQFSWRYVIAESARDDIARAYRREFGTGINMDDHADWTPLEQARIYDLCVKSDGDSNHRITEPEAR